VGPITRVMRGRKGPRSPEAVIAGLAAQQYGVVTRRQLLAAGLGEHAIDRRIGSVLHPVHAGVYAAGHSLLTMEGRWLAGVLACGDDSGLTHRAACALWGLRPSWREYVEVSAPRSLNRVQGVILHRPRTLELTCHRGIPVTPVGRTIVDVADVVVRIRALRAVLEQAEVLRLDCDAVPIAGRRGYGRLVAALAEHRPVVAFTRSRLEREFVALCAEAGLPKPRMNTIIDGMEVDAAWPELRLAVEVDSWKYHGTRTAHRRDRRRTAALQLAGWTVLRFTDEDIELDPGYVVETLRRTMVGLIPPARRGR
jgi:very-short-patch-repair endonuclease